MMYCNSAEPGPEIINKTFIMLNSTEHAISNAHKYKIIKLLSCSTQLSMQFQMLISIKISRNPAFFRVNKPIMLFFMLINVKMPLLAFYIYEQENFHAQLS